MRGRRAAAGQGRLGHEDLHLGNFLLSGGKLFLLDGYAVRLDGCGCGTCMMLGHSGRRFATTADLQRGWDQLGPGGPDAAGTTLSRRCGTASCGSVTRKGRYFGRLTDDAGWGGVYYKQSKYPHRWSAASQLDVSHEDWARRGRLLLRKSSGTSCRC